MVFTTTGKGILLNNQTGDVFALSMVSLPLVAVMLAPSSCNVVTIIAYYAQWYGHLDI
jgi:hypothetical protein